MLLPFLNESVVLCLLGGLGGIAVGALATRAIANYAGWPALFSVEAMVAAITVSASHSITATGGAVPGFRKDEQPPVRDRAAAPLALSVSPSLDPLEGVEELAVARHLAFPESGSHLLVLHGIDARKPPDGRLVELDGLRRLARALHPALDPGDLAMDLVAELIELGGR